MSVENIPISQLTEATEAADSDVLAIDNGTTTYKITVENFNATGTASAQAAADAAAQSAQSAADSASDALGYKNTVQSALNDASTIVSNAQSYANSAESSKNDASGYASAASTSASQASTSAGQAASYATGVQAYAIEAKSWAEGGTGTRVDEETTNCEYYANAAHTSETNAAASESNAASSESNAATSESNASSSASSASTNALKAEGYAVGSQNGTPAVSGETYYHDNAKYYKEQAASSESNAASSEYNAGLSESAAAASATAAGESEDDSEAWAWGKIDGVDVPATHPAYHNNAKYYADQASGGVSGVSSWNARTGNVVPAAHDYTANQVDYTNTTSGLTATDVQDAIDEVQGNISTVANGLGTAAAKDVPASGNASTTEVVMGDDTRLTDARTPVSHTHTKSEITDFPTLGTAAAKDSTNAVTQSSTDLVESGAVYSEVSSLNSALSNKYGTDDTAETTIDDADYFPFYDTSATAKRKSLWSNIKSVLKTYFDTLYATTTTVTNKHKVTRKTVNTSSWSTDTTSQSGTTLYKKSISLSHVYVDSPSVEISTSSGTGLPTSAQQTAYDLLQYVTVDGTTMYLYASAVPSTTFYIQIEGVD